MKFSHDEDDCIEGKYKLCLLPDINTQMVLVILTYRDYNLKKKGIYIYSMHKVENLNDISSICSNSN